MKPTTPTEDTGDKPAQLGSSINRRRRLGRGERWMTAASAMRINHELNAMARDQGGRRFEATVIVKDDLPNQGPLIAQAFADSGEIRLIQQQPDDLPALKTDGKFPAPARCDVVVNTVFDGLQASSFSEDRRS